MSRRVITISREYASGGHTIAKILSQELGIPFYDTQIIDEVVKKTGLDKEIVENAEKQVTSSFLFNLVMGMGAQNNYYEKIYKAQKDFVYAKLNEGPCIFVGRAANFILGQDVEQLRVFIYSTLDKRVEYAIKHYKLSKEKAQETIIRSDRDRALQSKNYYDKVWGARANYDVMLNSGELGVEGCVKILARIFRDGEI
ncbi:AAA family ATPase [Eubacterium oxidoreducens]|uniref:Cytidylate kinase n=1 Tax=Eubacterium oxidoreducens TaxID=1732 RepID=A0A1G6AAH0_EUBOX|nr:cytidylate kinase-like family protein [Eubacterium oxidoreducens]SDB05445.1 Cytidylate kinase [Eubacterium oxidoreducens]